MASSINASTSGAGGVITTADNSGILNLQSGGNTIATVQSTGFSLPTASTINAANTFGFKNRLINGSMPISQRGTSFTNVGSGGPPTYTLDRWCGWRGGYAANLDVSQVAGISTFQYALRGQRTSGSSSTASISIAQVIESTNSYDLLSQSVTVSFWAKAGSNYSGGQLSAILQYSTSANNTSSNLAAGSWTGGAGSSTSTISATATQYSFTATVPSNALSLAVQFNWTPTGTASTNDFIDFSGVQLEIGSQATSFDFRSYGTEFSLCQRYYQTVSTAQVVAGFTDGSTLGSWTTLQQTMRTTPTVTGSSSANVAGVGVQNMSYGSGAANSVYFGTTTYNPGGGVARCFSGFTMLASAEL